MPNDVVDTIWLTLAGGAACSLAHAVKLTKAASAATIQSLERFVIWPPYAVADGDFLSALSRAFFENRLTPAATKSASAPTSKTSAAIW